MNAHLSQDIIADYVAETLSQDVQVGVEEHVADCDRCALAAQGALAAGTVVDGWTARAHGAAVRGAMLAEALAAVRAHGAAGGLRRRLESWAEHWAGEAEATL
jgi:P2-related tail formation protein